MTLEEANLFFPHEEGDDLQELYDDRLFEYKQFFLAKTPIQKVFQSKVEKLQKMDASFAFLMGNESPAQAKEIENELFFPDSILEAFNLFEKSKGTFKQQIMMSQHAYQLVESVNKYLAITNAYRSKWFTDEELDITVEQLSKDPDPMEVLQAIRAFNEQGGQYFSDILRMNSNSFLLKEMKRLSLLIKNYGNGRSI